MFVCSPERFEGEGAERIWFSECRRNEKFNFDARYRCDKHIQAHIQATAVHESVGTIVRAFPFVGLWVLLY